jgi:hypothetical protein
MTFEKHSYVYSMHLIKPYVFLMFSNVAMWLKTPKPNNG